MTNEDDQWTWRLAMNHIPTARSLEGSHALTPARGSRLPSRRFTRRRLLSAHASLEAKQGVGVTSGGNEGTGRLPHTARSG